LGKKGREGTKVYDVPLGGDLPTVYINKISNLLKRIKGNADGKNYVQDGAIRPEPYGPQ
jgi:hypothetical protein